MGQLSGLCVVPCSRLPSTQLVPPKLHGRTNSGTDAGAGCRLRVNRVILTVGWPRPVYLGQRTSSEPVGMSQTCQPPHRGKWSDIVPHLSVAQLVNEQQVATVAEDLAKVSQGKFPIRAIASKIALMDNRSGRWGIRDLFSLDAGHRSAWIASSCRRPKTYTIAEVPLGMKGGIIRCR
jgi:hypothetical protein